MPSFGGSLPPGAGQYGNPYAANNFPVTGGNQLAFNPQLGNNRYERDMQLQRNVEMLGGLQSTLNPMEQSLTDHEMRFIGRNSLDPGHNNSLQQHTHNPYAQQQGLFGLASHQPRAQLPKQDVSQLEIGRMMRAEREQQMLEQERNNQKFGNFNRMLKGTVSGNGYNSMN